MQPEICSCLVLSTGHVTGHVASELDNMLEHLGPRTLTATGYPYEHGWWIWTGQEDGLDDLPPCLRACIDFARQHNCLWIKFDSDGPRQEELPYYEW